jgi:hypothetical protein
MSTEPAINRNAVRFIKPALTPHGGIILADRGTLAALPIQNAHRARWFRIFATIQVEAGLHLPMRSALPIAPLATLLHQVWCQLSVETSGAANSFRIGGTFD